MKKRVDFLPWVLVAWFVFFAGCAAADRSDNTLALGGYRSLTVEKVSVVGETPYDPDKFAELIHLGLKQELEQSLLWSRGEAPQALVAVTITRFREPSASEQFFVGVPYLIDYLITGRDAETDEPLGNTAGTAKFRLQSSILAEGLTAASFDHRFEQGWSDTTRQATITNSLLVRIAGEFDKAKRRPARHLLNTPITPVPPAKTPNQHLAKANE